MIIVWIARDQLAFSKCIWSRDAFIEYVRMSRDETQIKNAHTSSLFLCCYTNYDFQSVTSDRGNV